MVSVVIPVFNGEKYIGECLESVLLQKDQVSLDIIVVDDGSTDETVKCVRQFSMVRLLEQGNEGPASARNTGIAAARGDYIAFLDSDDIWPKDKLLIQLGIFARFPKVGLVFGDSRSFGMRGAATRSFFEDAGADESFFGGPLFVEDCYGKLLKKNFMLTGTVMVSRSCLGRVGGFDQGLRYVEDLDLWLRIARVFPVAYVNRALLLRRMHGRNTSRDVVGMTLAYVSVLDKQHRIEGRSLSRHGAHIRRRIAYEYCWLGDWLEKNGRSWEARRWYIKGFLRNPSLRPPYYWVRSFFSSVRAPERRGGS